MEKRENEIRPYGFCDRLVIKLIGKTEWIQRFISDIQKLYSADRITLSPILRNRDTDGFHCFINLLMPLPDIKKERNFDFKDTKTDSGGTE